MCFNPKQTEIKHIPFTSLIVRSSLYAFKEFQLTFECNMLWTFHTQAIPSLLDYVYLFDVRRLENNQNTFAWGGGGRNNNVCNMILFSSMFSYILNVIHFLLGLERFGDCSPPWKWCLQFAFICSVPFRFSFLIWCMIFPHKIYWQLVLVVCVWEVTAARRYEVGKRQYDEKNERHAKRIR